MSSSVAASSHAIATVVAASTGLRSASQARNAARPINRSSPARSKIRNHETRESAAGDLTGSGAPL